MKLRLSIKHSSKNIPSARPKGVKVRLRAFDAKTGSAEKKIIKRMESLPSPVASPKSLVLKKPDGRAKNGQHMKSNPPTSDQMKKVRAMRKFYGRHMPVPQCNTCAFSTNCPQFKADFECAYLPFLNSHKVDSIDDLMLAMETTVEANTQRLHLATIFERLSGAAPSAELSESYAMQFQQLQQLYELKKNGGVRPNTDGRPSTITQLFGNIQILVSSTASHHKEIAEAPIDLDTETNSQHQMALTDGPKKAFVPSELIEDFAVSKGDVDTAEPVRQSKPRTLATVSQGELTKI